MHDHSSLTLTIGHTSRINCQLSARGPLLFRNCSFLRGRRTGRIWRVGGGGSSLLVIAVQKSH